MPDNHLVSAIGHLLAATEAPSALAAEARGFQLDLLDRRTETHEVSGHSLIVGPAVTAAEHGATADEIATVTRHRSLEMPRRYAAKANQLRRSPFNRKGVGL